jgi:hypothetical protein
MSTCFSDRHLPGKKKIYQTQERGKYELDAQYSEAAEVELPFVVEQQESLPTSI